MLLSIVVATNEAAPTQLIHEAATLEPTSLILAAKMSKTSHKSLRKDLLILMKKMEEYNIQTCLANNLEQKLLDMNKHKLQLPTIKLSYINCCDKFAETEFQKVNSNVMKYMKQMTYFSGLLIFDYLTTLNKDMMLDYKNVLAHVLKYCLNGSFSNGELTWHSFFKKLIPHSAFKLDVCAPHLRNLAFYMRTCMDKMSIDEPFKGQFQFYLQFNYCSDMDMMNEKSVIEKKEKQQKGLQAQFDKRVRDESYDNTPIKANKRQKETKETSKDTTNIDKKELSKKPVVSNKTVKTKKLSKKQEASKKTIIYNPESKKTPSYEWVKDRKLVRPSSSSPPVSKQVRKTKLAMPPSERVLRSSPPKIPTKNIKHQCSQVRKI
jgi:hypothetical protein